MSWKKEDQGKKRTCTPLLGNEKIHNFYRPKSKRRTTTNTHSRDADLQATTSYARAFDTSCRILRKIFSVTL